MAVLAGATVVCAQEAENEALVRKAKHRLYSRLYAERTQAVEDLVALSEKHPHLVGSEILSVLDQDDQRARLLALTVISRMSYAPALPRLARELTRLSSRDFYERAAWLGAFVNFGREAERYILENGLEKDPLGQKVLGEIAVHDALKYITDFYDQDPDGNPGWYDGQFDGLKKRGRAAVFGLMRLVETYFGEDPLWMDPEKVNLYEVRWHAVFGLGEFRDDAALPLLHRVIRDVDRALAEKEPDFSSDQISSVANRARQTAVIACFKIGDREPLVARIQELRDEIDERTNTGFRRSYTEYTVIAQLYWDLALSLSPLKQTDEVVENYKKYMFWQERASIPEEEYAIGQYNIACAYSRANRLDESLEAFFEAIQMRYTELSWAHRDGDLAAMRSLPGYQLARAYAELVGIVHADQIRLSEKRKKIRSALDYIGLAIDKGIEDDAWIDHIRFRSLRDEPEFQWHAARFQAIRGRTADCADHLREYLRLCRSRGVPPEYLTQLDRFPEFESVKTDAAVKAVVQDAAKSGDGR